MNNKKKICFFSTNRADFNYIYSIFTFFHLKKFFKNYFVYNAINIKNNIFNNKNVIKYHFNFTGNTESNIVNEISKFSKIIGKYLSKYKFDYIFIIGDRYEAHLIASIANIYNLPVVHIHGGEVTQGSYDDKFRHSITKLSSIHFVANTIYRKRIIQMGEMKKNVFCTGSPTIDFLKSYKFYNRKYLSNFFKLNFGERNILICYNSVTNLSKKDSDFDNLLRVLKDFKNNSNIYFSLANNDINNSKINKSIKSFVKKNRSKNNVIYFNNIGSKLFLSLLKEVDVIVGNSSSAIIEAPYLGTKSINIGDRQKGRLMDNSIFDINGSLVSIKKTLKKILIMKNIKIKQENYYGTGNSIKKMHKYMINFSNKTDVHKKIFNDLNLK